MVLSTEWSQVEVIDLVNDGSGLGFGIVGGRSTGVVIKSILPGGIADKDGRLQSGDHIIQIGEVNLRGFSADQVASVLRQAGVQVRMVVARPIESCIEYQRFNSSQAPIVPTKILTDPEEVERLLSQNGYQECYNQNSYEDAVCGETTTNNYESNVLNVIHADGVLSVNGCSSPDSAKVILTPVDIEYSLPETERFTVELNKNEYGLGITIAGYVCEREDLSGIFVKSIGEGSEAHRCGRININDRIVEVDGECLHECTNYEAVEKLKQSGSCVKLTFERYLRGPKFEHLQEALASTETKDASPPSPSVTTLSWIPIDTDAQIIEPEGESVTTINSEVYESPETKEIFIDDNFEPDPAADCETSIKHKWTAIIGENTEIVVAHLTKLKGLGISLEGTVDVEAGVEVRPRHYIRSILPEGPVGTNGKLSPGDELLEVNGQKLLGIRHVDVVKILKELPSTVRLVCARESLKNRVINTSQDREGFEARNILGGSLKNLLPQPEQRLLKAQSDTSINTSSTVTITDENSLQKSKSRSLENTNLAMWHEEIDEIDLKKTDRGLGFSILDYQDPLDVKSTVIVIRSLVPNGAAELDGRIKPGDRLISVNGKVIKNVPLDQAVQALKSTLPGIVTVGISKPIAATTTSKTTENTPT
ncbi:PREDICTED: patj homolog [Nicrophorus vespilloides]|uniref:Patj homolog n=1 Tax=Nicrophorus vespilloides TaxID=110193 RepID=A0ABM1MPT3_NICVS|nr:PREDICTED: patj homolog [Nicrophorus vespilloides]